VPFSPGFQDPDYPVQPFFGGFPYIERQLYDPPHIPAYLDIDAAGEMDADGDVDEEAEDQEDEDEDDMDGSEEEEEEEDAQSEGDLSGTDSHSTSATTAVTIASMTSDTHDYFDTEWAHDRDLNMVTLEELRGDFLSELAEPSGWTIQRFITLTEAGSRFAAQEMVRLWSISVARWTQTPAGAPLCLPELVRPGPLPFHRPVAWEEVQYRGPLPDEWKVQEPEKYFGRLVIRFLFPEASTKGLSAVDKERLFVAASSVWTRDPSRAEGLLWVMQHEYPYTREGTGRGYPNHKSNDFMTYTVMFPPPIALTN